MLEEELCSSITDDRNPPMRIDLDQRTGRDEYLEKAENFLKHIRRGDIYEANYCMEFFSENAEISPVHTFLRLISISPMPAAAFYRSDKRFLLCSSPERYLQKTGSQIISQPIKGTVRKGKSRQEDAALKSRLLNSEKERGENVMITDLVRNDLSRTAQRGSVGVKELFGLKSYRTIHQLVTTIAAELDPRLNWTEAIRHSFPMGSMTGAPKIRAMEIIHEQESVARGLYSGSVGYITPEADFDLNVVIRSLQYNQQTRYLSCMTGSALTAACHPEEEYDECLLKAETMKQALS
jgi:para-aminobenzoate synthetase component 1